MMQLPARQRGYMIALVLIALVAMMISGLALVRSMDTNQVVAGNLAFRNSTIHSADQGINAAVTWLQSQTGTPQLNTNAPNLGYYAVAATLSWEDSTLWSQCSSCSTTDTAGNQVQWIVQRMCTSQGNANDPSNLCGSVAGGSSNPGDSGNSMGGAGLGSNFSNTAARINYRITVRVSGARGTNSLVQAYVLI